MSFEGKIKKRGKRKRGKCEGEKTKDKGELEVKKGKMNAKGAKIKPRMVNEK
jgi:hypothetical protein